MNWSYLCRYKLVWNDDNNIDINLYVMMPLTHIWNLYICTDYTNLDTKLVSDDYINIDMNQYEACMWWPHLAWYEACL